MATKKPPTTSRTRPSARPAAKSTQKPMTPSKLQNLAARPSYDDMLGDEQLVDASGVFRVTSAITQAQQGHDEDDSMFPGHSGSLPIARGDFVDDGPTLDDNLGERVIQDEAAQAEKRARLNTLAARAKARNRTR
jgi:hypothetical protein